MPLSSFESLIIILVVAAVTFSTRLFPFLIFPEGKEVPEIVKYLGKYLTPAIIGLLVIYCLKSTQLISYPYAIPETIAIAIVVLLHIWKRNNLLSIGVGTVLYMILIQYVF